jgi:hypothetical protein
LSGVEVTVGPHAASNAEATASTTSERDMGSRYHDGCGPRGSHPRVAAGCRPRPTCGSYADLTGPDAGACDRHTMARRSVIGVSHIVGIVAALAAAVAVANAGPDDAPPPRWLCIPHHAGPFNECWKGNSFDEASVERCLVAQRRKKRRQPRIRLDRGAWIEAPRRGRRCVELPTDHRPRVTVENFGRTYASWKLDTSRPCRSGTLLVIGPNFYGSMYAQCTKRAATAAEQRGPDAP